MADEKADAKESDRHVVRSSAIVLLLTGIALAGCVALAVGVTVQLVDLPRPRVTADATAADSANPETAGSVGAAANFALVGSAASSATNLANEQAARLAARRERAREAVERASRSRARNADPTKAAADPTPTPVVTPTATPTATPQPPDGYYQHRRPWHPYPPR